MLGETNTSLPALSSLEVSGAAQDGGFAPAGAGTIFSGATPASATTTLPVPDSTLDFTDFQFSDDAFLEDILLCQFTYNPSGLTVPSTPTATAASLASAEDIPNFLPQLTVTTPIHSHERECRKSPAAKSALQVTSTELEAFFAKLSLADVDGDLGHFQKPSLSRTSRCIISYFRYFDPHAPIVHYASFSIAKTHRQPCPRL
jgi:hypothetical protein